MSRARWLSPWLCAIALLAVGLGACNVDSRWTSTTFDGDKQLQLYAAYSANADSTTIGAFADVPIGTAGTIEMTGPFHMRCQGQFRPPDPTRNENLPYLEIGEGEDGTAGIQTPSGDYVAIATIPSKNARVSNSFHAGGPRTAITVAIPLPLGCVPVADSSHELEVLVAAYATGLQFWVTRVDQPALKSQLLSLVVQAAEAASGGDRLAAAGAMTQIKDLVQPLSTQNPYYAILQGALASIALFTQPLPSR